MQVILIARLHAMYQRSRKVLIFLVVILLAVNIFDGVVVAISVRKNSWGTLNHGSNIQACQAHEYQRN